MTGDGERAHTAWFGKGDGVLAIDLAADGTSGPDGIIDQAREIVFTQWAPGASSDMTALRQVFDTNHNGSLDPGDAHWGEFRVWQDADGDGVSQPSEVKTLADLGITAIGLTPSGPARQFSDGSTIQGISTFTRLDGTGGTCRRRRPGIRAARGQGAVHAIRTRYAVRCRRDIGTDADGHLRNDRCRRSCRCKCRQRRLERGAKLGK